MSDDLVRKLREARYVAFDECGDYDLAQEAATALTEARAEIERLTEQARRDREYSASQAGEHVKLVNRTLAAESELSTLRARVREVVGPFARINAFEVAFSEHGKTYRLDYNATFADQLAFRHFRAARQLNEDLKDA